jgi:hypothetical protein
VGTPGLQGGRVAAGYFFRSHRGMIFFERFFRQLSIIKTVFADPANIDFSRILINVTGGN